MANNSTPRLDLSKPRYDQSVFSGRLRHFMETANPLNVLVPSKRLEDAAKLVTEYRLHGTAPPGTSEEQLWKAKRLYDSAYHPDTGKKMFVVGRMSAQVPMNMTIVGCMMTFHRSPGAIIFWQWVNQSFNAIVNHTNRSGGEEISARQLMVPYAAATTAATVTALGLNEVAKRLPSLIGRFVPFAAVAAANSINIPLMRQKELQAGIPIVDESGKKVGMSKAAAKKAITQVILSRIFMAMPAMVIPPFIMNNLEKRGILTRMPWINAPTQIALVGLCLVFATPFCCALFPQMSSISVSKLEEGVKKDLDPALLRVYYNKGL